MCAQKWVRVEFEPLVLGAAAILFLLPLFAGLFAGACAAVVVVVEDNDGAPRATRSECGLGIGDKSIPLPACQRNLDGLSKWNAPSKAALADGEWSKLNDEAGRDTERNKQ